MTGAIGGADVPPGMVKRVSALTLGSNETVEHKAAAIVVASKELLRFTTTDAANVFATELRRGVASVTDSTFLSLITNGVSATSSNGSTSVAILQDLAGALGSMTLGSTSRLFVIVNAQTASAWSTKTTSTGARAFDRMTPTGGEICGMACLVSDDLAANTFCVIDADQIVAATGSIDVAGSQAASLQMDTAPDSPATASSTYVSLFQQGMAALKAERVFTAQRQRDTAVAVISNVSYSGNSPA